MPSDLHAYLRMRTCVRACATFKEGANERREDVVLCVRALPDVRTPLEYLLPELVAEERLNRRADSDRVVIG